MLIDDADGLNHLPNAITTLPERILNHSMQHKMGPMLHHPSSGIVASSFNQYNQSTVYHPPKLFHSIYNYCELMYSERESRDISRERSRDRERKPYHHRQPSEDSDRPRRKYPRESTNSNSYRYRSKRVKFQETPDVKVFRKEDQPSAKGLDEDEICSLKTEIQKQIAKSYDFNWQHFRHRDAESEANSRKELKEKEKMLGERLGSVREGMGYLCPVGVSDVSAIVELGVDSEQRLGHTIRINDILGCYYTQASQIPSQPLFQIINTSNTTDCKIIKFDNDNYNSNLTYASTKKIQEKDIKGILKATQSTQPPPQNRHIDPQLILLLKELKLNPNIYSKEKTEMMLKPYKESGELEYLTKNKEVLEIMLRNIVAPMARAATATGHGAAHGTAYGSSHGASHGQSYGSAPRASNSISAGRDSNERGQTQNYHNPPSQNMSNMSQSYAHTFVPKADKYRTVPCKYFHSHLGCNKVDNCTYIHDDRYPGVSVPPNYSSSGASSQPSRMSSNYHSQVGMYAGYPPANPSRMPVGGNQAGYMIGAGGGSGSGGSYPNTGGGYYQNPSSGNDSENYPGGGGSGYSGGSNPRNYSGGQGHSGGRSNYPTTGSSNSNNYSGSNPSNYQSNGSTHSPANTSSNYPDRNASNYQDRNAPNYQDRNTSSYDRNTSSYDNRNPSYDRNNSYDRNSSNYPDRGGSNNNNYDRNTSNYQDRNASYPSRGGTSSYADRGGGAGGGNSSYADRGGVSNYADRGGSSNYQDRNQSNYVERPQTGFTDRPPSYGDRTAQSYPGGHAPYPVGGNAAGGLSGVSDAAGGTGGTGSAVNVSAVGVVGVGDGKPNYSGMNPVPSSNYVGGYPNYSYASYGNPSNKGGPPTASKPN